MRLPKHIEDHFHFLRTRVPCVVCLNDVEVELCHIRYSDFAAGKTNPGMGTRDHNYVVILCRRHHDEQHHGNERVFWQRHGIDPIVLSRQLWSHTGDAEACERIIRKWGLH